MVVNFPEFEEKIINALKASGLIEKFSLSEINSTPDLATIIRYFNEPTKIDYDDNGLFFIDDNEEKTYCPMILVSITEKGAWLSDMLPDVRFDIDQSGNVRKADEAEAMFICIIIARILKDSVFRTELEDVARKYDFEAMKPFESGSLNFREILKDWQSMQSEIINILVSAAKFKISSVKKDTEKFLKDGIKESEVIELRDLESKIRSINFNYSQGVLSPMSVKMMTKIERLQSIDQRDDEIVKAINSSRVGVLYKAMKLSSEYISPVKKKKISLWVQKEIDAYLSKQEFKDLNQERSQLISKFVRRAYRFEKNSIRRLAVEKYIQNPAEFKLPSKL